MSKPPIGEISPAAGGSHFSDRRGQRRQNGPQHVNEVDGLGDTESLPEEDTTQCRAGQERTQAEKSAQKKRTKSNVRPGYRHEKQRLGRRRNQGYGVNAKENVGESANLRRNSTNRRPGRKPASKSQERKIQFPPRPHRQHAGLDQHQKGKFGTEGSMRKRSAVSKSGNLSRQFSGSSLYAALDLGTNNCRLLVALPQRAGNFRVVDGFSRIVRLGKGMQGSGILDQEAMDRAVIALGECAKKLKNSNIKKMRLIATEACRQAENGEKFIDRVKRETGLDLEVIDRETEALLAAEGCGALVDKKADGAVLFDIGGGSSELILLDRRGRRNRRIANQISSWTSLPVGVVTLSERHGGKHVSRSIFDAMVEEVEGYLSKFEGRKNLDEFWHKGRVHLLGTSGTVTTLAGVHLKLPRYDRRQVDGIWLKDIEVDAAIEQLVEMEFHQRAENPCIGTERADLVLAGCAILQAIRKTWPSPRLRVADRGLREGLLTQMMNQDGAWISAKKGRRNDRQKTHGLRNKR